MGRHSCCYKQKLRKGLWSPEEDEKLVRHITMYGHGCWSSVPKLAGLQRCGKSCRLRWINYLRPDLKRGTFSQQEEDLVIKLHAILRNRWSQIASQLPGRTDNEIKNLWNSSIKKKLIQRGIDPKTHKPLSESKNENNMTFSPSSDVTEKNSPTKFTFPAFNPSSLSDTQQDNKIPTNSPPNKDLFPGKLGDKAGPTSTKPLKIFPLQEINYGSTFPFPFPQEQTSRASWLSHHHHGYNPFRPTGSSANEKWLFYPETCEKDVQLHADHEPEDRKWSEYLNIPFLAQNHQEKQTLPQNHENTPETKFASSYLSSSGVDDDDDVGSGNNHKLPSQAADIYCRDIRRSAAAFGNF